MHRFALSSLIVCSLTLFQPAIAQEWSALPRVAPAPADNPTTPAKVELGKMLFFDPRFSADGTVSCFSCHNVMEGGDDHRPTSIGIHAQKGGRNSPTVWNAAFMSVQFWDGRAATLEDQAKGPLVNPIEMGMKDLTATIERIRRIPGYKATFAKAFGAGDVVTLDNAAKAIAAYERTLITPNSPYDRFVLGDRKALTPQQQRGMQAFASTGCVACHAGAMFNGPSMPVGTGFFQKFPINSATVYDTKYRLLEDKGLAVASGRAEDAALWRVPTLRNLIYTAPYLHNGSVKSLEEMVRLMGKTQLNVDVPDATVADIVAFLGSLTGEFPQQTMPRLPPTPGNLLL